MEAGARDERVAVRMSKEERDKLRTLAKDDGLSISDWIRATVNKAFRERELARKRK